MLLRIELKRLVSPGAARALTRSEAEQLRKQNTSVRPYSGLHWQLRRTLDGKLNLSWHPRNGEGATWDLAEFGSCQCSAKRSIFVDALSAHFMNVTDPDYVGGFTDLEVRRDVIAQQILLRYSRDTTITRDLYDQDLDFAEALNWLDDRFEFPDWEGRKMSVFLERFGETTSGTASIAAYKITKHNASGVCLGFLTLDDFLGAIPDANGDWLIKSSNFVVKFSK